MTGFKQRPKAKKQLNQFKQNVQIVDITNNGLESYILAIELERGTITGAKQPFLVQVSKELFGCRDDARQALQTKDYPLPEDLKSYLLHIQWLNLEGTGTYITADEVIEEKEADEVSYVIGNLMQEHNDDAPDTYTVNAIVSKESWKTKEQAQQALDTGDWTLINEWDLNNYYIESGPLKVKYDKLREGFIYCREIFYRNEDDDSQVMVDYLECSSKAYVNEYEATQALKDYLASI